MSRDIFNHRDKFFETWRKKGRVKAHLIRYAAVTDNAKIGGREEPTELFPDKNFKICFFDSLPYMFRRYLSPLVETGEAVSDDTRFGGTDVYVQSKWVWFNGNPQNKTDAPVFLQYNDILQIPNFINPNTPAQYRVAKAFGKLEQSGNLSIVLVNLAK